MSDSLADLLVTDAELDLIACRERQGGRDLVLAELAMMAAAIDDLPLPPVMLPAVRPPMTTVRKGGWALTVTVALMVTSSGVAAAVSDDPMGPLSYVSHQFWKIGPHDSNKMPGWQLDGALPISTVKGGRPPAGAVSPLSSVVGGVDPNGAGGSDPAFGIVSGRPGGSGSRVAGFGHGSGGSGGSGSGGSGSGPGGSGPGGSRPGSGNSGSGSSPGGGNGGGGSGRPPASRSGPGVHAPKPPTLGGGQGPGNTGNGPGAPTDPSLPGQPVSSGQHHGPGNPKFGRLPGTGTGTENPPCRIDRPNLPGPWSGPAQGLDRCHTSPLRPGSPGSSSPGLSSTLPAPDVPAAPVAPASSAAPGSSPSASGSGSSAPAKP